MLTKRVRVVLEEEHQLTVDTDDEEQAERAVNAWLDKNFSDMIDGEDLTEFEKGDPKMGIQIDINGDNK